MQDLIARAEKHRASPEGPRRDRRGGGILDRRPDFGGAAGACPARPPTSSAAPSSIPRLPGGPCWIFRISLRSACAPRPSPMRGCWRKPRGNASRRAGRWPRAEPPGRAAIATAIRPAIPASPWPVRSSGRPRSKPASADRVANMRAFSAAALDLLLDVLAGKSARRPDGTPVRQTAGKVTAKQLPRAES